MKPATAHIYKRLLNCLLLSVSMAVSYAQTTPEQQLVRYNEKVLQEKIYLHSDRSFYLAGDLLWFKLYYVDAALHQPLNLSKVAYIEILDADNKPAAQVKTSMEDGKGKGSVYLPVTLSSGHYKIRAYTNWMKNFGPDLFFEKQITIVNTQKQRDSIAVRKKEQPDIQFFPEGGNLVYGLTSRVACKVTAPGGRGLEYTGRIVDEQDKEVVNFRAEQFGMASFSFTPDAGHTYHAVMDIDRNRTTAVLPKIYGQGYVMNVTPGNNNEITITVHATTATELYLVAHTRQSVKASRQATIKNGVAVFNVNKNELGDGITHFTLFNAARQPVCERLYFKYPEDNLSIAIAGNNSSYSTRSKIALDITSLNTLRKTTAADMSIAVYELDAFQEPEETNINTYLWLSSELRGHIESPAYYFEDITSTVVRDMDNLMLTQGWRRFRWSDVLENKTPVFTYVPEYKGPIVTGKVVNAISGTAMPSVETYAAAPGIGTVFMAGISDSLGRVHYEMPGLKGSAELIVQTAPSSDTLARIEIANPFSENYTATRLPTFTLLSATETTLLDRSVGTQAQNVYAGKKMNPFGLYIDTTTFYESPVASYYLDNYVRFSTMEEVLREYVQYMDVHKKGKTYEVPLLDMNTTKYFLSDPLILVDGVPVFDVAKLMAFDPLKFRKLETVQYRYFVGNANFTGIMNWHTYKGDLGGYELNPRATVIDYEGLQAEREFYSPVYDTPEKTAGHIPDFRSVLYWSPDLQTNANGKTHVEFYSSDKKGKYLVVIQGITSNGQPGVETARFEVR